MKKISAIAILLFSLLFFLAAQTQAASLNTTSVIDYRQCANGTGTDITCSSGWINGILHNPNSHYQEDQSVPQRLVLSVDSGDLTGRTIALRYETRKNGIHAYDSITTWNSTVTGADECQGLAAADCPSLGPSILAIPPDPTTVNPFTSGSGVTSAYQISGHLEMYGGTITNISAPVHNNAASSTGDDYATVIIEYSVPEVPTKVMLLWGGHTAATDGPRGWGTGLGSSNVSGGPYHFKLDQADGAAIGSRDNQLQGASLEDLTPIVTTTIHNPNHDSVTSVPAGTTVHDTVSVTGTGGTVTGEVTFDFFNNGTCSDTPAATSDIVTLSGGLADATAFVQGPLDAGSYSFMAHYTGDNNYAPGDGSCEPLTVTQLTPTVATDIHLTNHDVVTSVDLGSTVHDKASVTGAFRVPTGTVDFTFYTSGDCTTGGSASGTGIALTDGIADPSSNQGPLEAGSYAFKAHYNGNTNYVAADGSCEPLTVNKGTPSVVTELHNSDESVITSDASTDTVHDKATVTGITAFAPTGDVNFTFYANNACSEDGTLAGNIAVTAGIAHPSTSQGPLGAGLYAFKAHYNGDNNYNELDSSCEPFSITTLEVTKSLIPSNDTGVFNLQIDSNTKKSDATNGGTTGTVIVPSGSHTVGEVAGTNTDLSNYQGVIGGDCAANGTITPAAGDAKSCSITNTRKGKITIIKDAQPNDLQDFAFGGTLSAFSLDDDAAVSGGDDTLLNTKLFDKLTTGQDYVFTETEPNQYWTLDGISCENGTFTVNGTTLTVTNLQPAANVTCTFANLKLGPTRTLGFWQTHTNFTSLVFGLHPFTIGNNGTHKGPMDINKVFGGFYANIAKKLDGKTKRLAVDQQRMILLQQLLAAKLNCAQFSCPGSVQALIIQADLAYTSGSPSMTGLAGQLDAYNNSGDTIVISPPPGNATPKSSLGMANISFWDLP